MVKFVLISIYFQEFDNTALKIMASQWSLTIVTAFETANKLHSMVTMTANS